MGLEYLGGTTCILNNEVPFPSGLQHFHLLLNKDNVILNAHPITYQHGNSVFVNNMNNTRVLDPGLSVHLNWNWFVGYGYLHCMALCYSAMLHPPEYFRHSHLTCTKNCNNFKHPVIERRGVKSLKEEMTIIICYDLSLLRRCSDRHAYSARFIWGHSRQCVRGKTVSGKSNDKELFLISFYLHLHLSSFPKNSHHPCS